MDAISQFFASAGFMPYGYCFHWSPGLLWTYVGADTVIAASYYSIPVALWTFVRRRADLPFSWLFLMFAAFILACGTSHLSAILDIWKPVYWLDAGIKTVTAIASLTTAVVIWPLIPKALALPNPKELDRINLDLSREVAARREAEERLQVLNQDLEQRVAERTAAIELANDALRRKMEEHELALQAVSDGQQLIRTIIDNATAVIFVKQLSGRYLLVNRRFEEVFHIAPHDAVEKTDDELFERERADAFRAADEMVAAGQTFETEEVVVLDGRPHTHLTVRFPILDLVGRIVAIGGMSTDITERKRDEERLRLVVEAAPNAMIMMSRDGRIVLVNSQTEKVFGYSRDELIGQRIEMLVPERYRGIHPAYRAGFMLNPTSRPMGVGRHLFGVRRDGSEVPLEIALNPIEIAEGMFTLAAVVDITERRRLEERFRATVESAPAAMVMIDCTGSITLVNALTEMLFGYRRDELIGQPVEILVPQRYRAAHPGLRDDFFRIPSARRMGEGRDLYGQRSNGSEFPVEIGLNPVETSDGVFVLAAIVDITERKRAEDELRERSDELTRSNLDLEQFAYVASHDLQEPLRAITGPLQLLQRRYEGQLDERADEFIGHAVDAASRMQSLIDDLLAFSRVGRTAEPWQPTECAEALDNALRNLEAAIQDSGAQIIHDALPTVHAIPGQISVLFQNLVGNAIKFRSRDRPVRIHVGANARDDTWVFHVQDNGIGIADRYFERIFLIFQRLHTRRDYPGTGIGLALCKRIVEHHDGRIWVESEPGVGTTFFFTLPRHAGGSVIAEHADGGGL